MLRPTPRTTLRRMVSLHRAKYSDTTTAATVANAANIVPTAPIAAIVCSWALENSSREVNVNIWKSRRQPRNRALTDIVAAGDAALRFALLQGACGCRNRPHVRESLRRQDRSSIA